MFCVSFWVALNCCCSLLFALTVMPYIVPAVHPGRLYPRLSSISHLVTCSNRTTDQYLCECSIQRFS